MKMRSASLCAGLLLLIGVLTAEAAGPLTQFESWMSLGSPAHDLVIDGDLAYVVTDLGLRIVDLSPLNLPTPAAPVPFPTGIKLGGKSFGIAFKSPYVYVANQTKDLQVIDVSNPAAPVLKATKTLPGSAWDVAVKDNVAYVADYNGELRVIDISNPLSPQVIKVLGLLVWSAPSADGPNIAKLKNYVTSGNAKNTGVAVGGNYMAATDWNSGRLYFYNVGIPGTPGTPSNPIFAGTHYVPFTFRVKINAEGTWAYTLAAYGYSSGIYSFPLNLLNPDDSTYHAQCDDDDCGFFAVTPTDYGGLGLTANGRYVMSIAGKKGEVDVIHACKPSNLIGHSFVAMPPHAARTAQSMGVAQYGDYVIAAGAALGLGVFQFPLLSNPCPPE